MIANFELNESLIQNYNNDENISITDILVAVLKSKKDFISLFLITIDKIRVNDQIK